MKFLYRTDDDYSLDAFSKGQYYSIGSLDQRQFERRVMLTKDQSKLLANHLLKTRIKNLRDKYSYIRLWFSGGKDSTLALQTAIKNNVFIDEIVVIKRVCKRGPNLYPEFS